MYKMLLYHCFAYAKWRQVK